MVLAHNKSLITYLYKAIEHRNIASVGYYIGGMKEQDLKLSESKKIIIAIAVFYKSIRLIDNLIIDYNQVFLKASSG